MKTSKRWILILAAAISAATAAAELTNKLTGDSDDSFNLPRGLLAKCETRLLVLPSKVVVEWARHIIAHAKTRICSTVSFVWPSSDSSGGEQQDAVQAAVSRTLVWWYQTIIIMQGSLHNTIRIFLVLGLVTM